MTVAYVGLGSNLGDREGTIRKALARLNERDVLRVRKISAFYETKPVGYPDQPDFLNAVCEIETGYPARELLAALRETEDFFGRERKIEQGPRTLDLDLLAFGDWVVREEGLILPHPRMHERDFVLRPFLDVNPDWVHPMLGRSVRVLFEKLTAAGV
ncbi:MAG TPA: 2-amino-4-hydroxy-6-hydroxymethyldihydropteridine diphosphokinase [Candidatus Omnitrophota bacterium]|nr:2-amino-4-hydroxy-6-hydroxymethyldihydropteridine diphosphokinase [Candidatus Omnitrophota bacterium]